MIMAGFFGFFDYTKDGPEIKKDAPPKPRIIVFFEILKRKFWTLCRLNLLYLVFSIPSLLIALYVSDFFLYRYTPEEIANVFLYNLVYNATFAIFLISMSVVAIGPVQAGFTYILRNFAREEHAFLWWDFKDTAKRNWKQSTIVCIIDLIVTLILAFDVTMYSVMDMPSTVMSFGTGFVIVIFILYLMMHLYIYPMLITFDLNIRQIYKNALIFAIIKFIPNLGIILLCLLTTVATTYLLFSVNLFLSIVAFIFILFSLNGLIINYYVYPVLKKYMIDGVNTDKEDNKSNEKSANKKKNVRKKEANGREVTGNEESATNSEATADKKTTVKGKPGPKNKKAGKNKQK